MLFILHFHGLFNSYDVCSSTFCMVKLIVILFAKFAKTPKCNIHNFAIISMSCFTVAAYLRIFSALYWAPLSQ